MKAVINFPPSPILAALLDETSLEDHIQQAITIAQWGGLMTHKMKEDLPKAIKPASLEDAVKAGKAITETIESLSERKPEAATLFLSETEPLFQRLLAWHRWHRYHRAPWTALFERSNGIDLEALEKYSREGYTLSIAFGTEKQAASHLRGYNLYKEIQFEEIEEGDANNRVTRAARNDQKILNKLRHRRQKRDVLALGNHPVEEYYFFRTIAAYMGLQELESLLQK